MLAAMGAITVPACTADTSKRLPPRTSEQRALATPPQNHHNQGRHKAIVGVTVIDVRNGVRLRDHTVRIDGNRIVEVGPRARVRVPAGAVRIDGRGKFLIPGLVDAHVHLFQSGGLFTRPDVIDLRHRVPYQQHQDEQRKGVPSVLRRYLRSGITSIVDVGGPFWNFEARRRSRTLRRAPRVFVAGPLIASHEPENLRVRDRPIRKVTTKAEALALLERQLAHRPNLIKILYVPRRSKPSARSFFRIVRAVARRVHAAGLPLYVHAFGLATAKLALQAGADVLVHSVVDQPVDGEFLRLAKERGAVYVPTLWLLSSHSSVLTQQLRVLPVEHRLGDPQVIGTLLRMGELKPQELSARLRKRIEAAAPKIRTNPTALANLKRVHDEGVPVAVGTDAGNIGVLPGPAIFREMALMRQAGLSPAQILRAATWNGARMLRRQDRQGAIARGLVADLVLLDADPLADIENTQRISMVIKDGHALSAARIAPRSPVDVVQIQINAYNSRDLETFLSVYDSAVEVSNLPGPVKGKGIAGMRKVYGRLFKRAPNLHCRLVNRIAMGAWVIDQERVTGIPNRPALDAIAIYRIERGRIRRVWFLR